MSLKGSCCWWKTFQPNEGDWGGKPDKGINRWKTSELDEEMWEENRKIIDIVDEKTFQPGLRTGKEKPRLVERGGVCSRKDLFEGETWMIRDLDDKGLGQNKVLCSSSGVELLWSTTMQAPRQRSPRQGDRSPATCRLLALRTALTRIPPCRLFLVTSLSAFSASWCAS